MYRPAAVLLVLLVLSGCEPSMERLCADYSLARCECGLEYGICDPDEAKAACEAGQERGGDYGWTEEDRPFLQCLVTVLEATCEEPLTCSR